MKSRFLSLVGGIALLAMALSVPLAPVTQATSGSLQALVAGPPHADPGVAESHARVPLNPDGYVQAKSLAAHKSGQDGGSFAGGRTDRRFGSGAMAGWDGGYQTGLAPPDPISAVSPSRFIEMINVSYGIYQRDGTLLAAGPTGNLTGANPFPHKGKYRSKLTDPEIRWDPATGVFYYVVMDYADSTIALGFSKNDGPASPNDFCHYWTSWGYRGNPTPGIADFPMLGSTQGNLLIGVNRFTATDAYLGSDVLTVRKPAVPIATCPAAGTVTAGLKSFMGAVTTGTPVPAWQTDPSPTGNVVAAEDPTLPGHSPASAVSILSFTDGVDGLPVQGATSTISVPSYQVPANAPQPPLGGTTYYLDSNDTRFTLAVSAIDPSANGGAGALALWTAHAVFGGAGSEVRWYEIDAAAGTLIDSGTVSDPSLFVIYPAIAPDRAANPGGSPQFGDSWMMSVDTSSTSQFTAIQMITRRAGHAPSGLLMVKPSSGVNYDFTCGPNSPTSPCRWGDFMGASPDPVVPLGATSGSVWFTSEYNVASAPGSSATDWRTWNWMASWAPTGLAATASSGAASLAWAPPAAIPAADIDHYDVYRSDTSGAEFPGVPVGTSTAPSYLDTGLINGATYFYEVTAVYGDSAITGAGESGPSNEASATPQAIVALLTVPASPTKNATLSFGATFDRSVSGLASEDFSTAGSATGCSVGTPSGSGAAYTVAVAGCSDGTVSLTLLAGAVADSGGGSGPDADVTSAEVTVDRTAPSLSTPVLSADSVDWGVPVTVNATAADDVAVASAARSVGGATWVTLSAVDGAFGGTSEDLSGTFAAPLLAGTYQVCVRATDSAGNLSDGSACATLTVLTSAPLPVPVVTYTGPTTANGGSTATLSATLTESGGAAISGRTVTFLVSGSTLTGTTSTSGVASVSWAAPAAGGSFVLDVTFDGDVSYSPASTSTTIAVKTLTVLTYTGPTTAVKGATLTLSATLTGAASPISGATVTFTFNKVTYTRTTDASGIASVNVSAPMKKGNYSVVVRFAGDATRLAASASASIRVA